MTFRFTIIDVKKLSDARLYVEGSESGPLISKIDSDLVGFQINCSRKCILKIKAFEKNNFVDVNTAKLIGQTFFSAPRFIEENKHNQQMHKSEYKFQYETNVFNQNDLPVGTIKFKAIYYKTQLYCGEQSRVFEQMSQIPQSYVEFFRGQCNDRNMFSYFDSGNEEKPYNCIEGVYRDNTWAQR